MTQTLTLPSLEIIPDDIEAQLKTFLQNPTNPQLEAWLYSLIKGSGHLSTGENMRWRVFCQIWLVTQFSVDKAWPYLMWLNNNEPVMNEQLNEILSEAAVEFQSHVLLANWISACTDERLTTFFESYTHIPPSYDMPRLMQNLLAQGNRPETGVWLAYFCRDSADNPSPYMRPWRLINSAWYAASFNPSEGLTYLQKLSNGTDSLSAEDNAILMDALSDLNGLTGMIQWIADCPDNNVRQMLREVGHPNLPNLVSAIFQNPPDYGHLMGHSSQAEADFSAYQRYVRLFEEAGLNLKQAKLLNLACGPLASQTLLFNSAGYEMAGADLDIPPAYLPLEGIKQRLKRGQYVKAWKNASESYYTALSQLSQFKLKWNKVKISLADLTRLDFAENTFEAVLCHNHLHHAPNVKGLLTEAARVLKPGGIFVANIVPYASLGGAFNQNEAEPWAHLRNPDDSVDADGLSFNRWPTEQFKSALEDHFTLLKWQVEVSSKATSLLNDTLSADLSAFSVDELTCEQIMVVGRKK